MGIRIERLSDEQADYIRETLAGNGFPPPRMDEDDTGARAVEITDDAAEWLRTHLSVDDDGHLDDRWMWIGGSEYPLYHVDY